VLLRLHLGTAIREEGWGTIVFPDCLLHDVSHHGIQLKRDDGVHHKHKKLCRFRWRFLQHGQGKLFREIHRLVLPLREIRQKQEDSDHAQSFTGVLFRGRWQQWRNKGGQNK